MKTEKSRPTKPWAQVGMCWLMALPAMAADRPNILWLSCEDTGPHLGCYGDAYSVTPNLDGLAQRGLRYTRAWSNAPVCAPARTTVISGLYPPSAGAENMRSMVPMPGWFRMFPQFLRDAGYYCTNNSKEDYNLVKPGEVWDESSRKAHWKNRPSDKPFFAVFNFQITHESQIRNRIEDLNRIHDPGEVRVPAYHPDTPEVRRDWAQYYDRITMMDRECGNALQEIVSAGLLEDTIVFFWGDHGSGMPRNKRWPYNSGLHVPLILHVPPKWKSLAPREYQAGGTSDRLVGFVDFAPTMLSLAGIEPPKWMQGGAFAGRFAAQPRDFNFGFRGRMDERFDLVRTATDGRYVYVRNFMPHRIYGQHISYMFATPTTQVWQELFRAGKLNEAQSHFWQTKPAEELYDLQSDRDEVANLVGSSSHQEVLARLRAANEAHLKDTRDVEFLPEYEFHARARRAGVTPYDVGQDPKLYDFERIFEAAQVATSRRAEDLPPIVGCLADKDSGIRYWGALGLRIHEKAGVEAGREALVRALGDVSPAVQIVAAETLGLFGPEADVGPALDVLMRWVDPSQDVFLSLAAWSALDALDERARPVAEKLAAINPQPLHPPDKRVAGYAARAQEKVLEDLGLAKPGKPRKEAEER